MSDSRTRWAGYKSWVGYVVIGAVTAVFTAGWAVMLVLRSGDPQISSQLVAYEVARNSVTIDFQVVKPEDRTAVCRLRALDAQHLEVGSREVTLPPGSDVELTERVVTTGPPVSGEIASCRLV